MEAAAWNMATTWSEPLPPSVKVRLMLGMFTKVVEVVHASTISSTPVNLLTGAVWLTAAARASVVTVATPPRRQPARASPTGNPVCLRIVVSSELPAVGMTAGRHGAPALRLPL
jgi:hypothetical protein